MNKTLDLVQQDSQYVELYKQWFLKRDKKQMHFIMTNPLIIIPSFYSYDNLFSQERNDILTVCEGGYRGIHARLNLLENLGYYSVINPRVQLDEKREKYLEEIKKLPKISLSPQQAMEYSLRNFSLSATSNFSLSKFATASCGVLNPDLEIKRVREFFISNLDSL